MSNLAFFVKWSKQRAEFLLTRPGSSLKIKFIHSFLMLGSEGRQCRDCFPQLGTALLSSEHRYHLFCGIDVHVCLYLHYVRESVGGAKQAVMWRRCLSTLWHHRVEHSTSCCFGRLTSIKPVLKLWNFYSTMTSNIQCSCGSVVRVLH